MPSGSRPRRPAMYNTPNIRTGGFGALQVEAITNRPLSIARRHLAASQLRMRDIEPDELSSSEWVRFLVMEGRERDRWIQEFQRRRRDSSGSSSSSSSQDDMDLRLDSQTAYDKAEEARLEAEDARRAEQMTPAAVAPTPRPALTHTQSAGAGATPFVSLWARHLDELEQNERTDTAPSSYSARRPMHMRRSVDTEDAPPSYNTAVRSGSPPPAYEPRSDGEDDSAPSPRSRMSRWSSHNILPRF